MSVRDDREEFEAHKRRQAIAMGRDEALQRRCVDTIKALDKYDYSYLWSWMGVPIIQMPPDIMATQEVIWATRPDIIVETGVARGGSLLFMASLLELIGKGRVIGVDVEIRPHNRDAIESHPMSERVTLIEGSSIEEETVAKVRAEIPDGASVMVVLDSDHRRDHVLAELRAYGQLVSEGCYLVVADTIIGYWEESDVNPNRSDALFRGNEPLAALREYLQDCGAFIGDDAINGKLILSSSPGGYLRRRGRSTNG